MSGIRKVVDKKTDRVLFIGTYKQAVDYCIHNNLGKFYEYTWEDHVIDGGDLIEIREHKPCE